MPQPKMFPLDEAIKAQRSLRQAAGLGPEQFPIQAFVGMISDEIDALRANGMTDDQIATLIREHSAIDITADEISDNYATPNQRHAH